MKHERRGWGKMQSKNIKRKRKYPKRSRENTEKISYIQIKAGDGFEEKKI